jgi:hypothetical protein
MWTRSDVLRCGGGYLRDWHGLADLGAAVTDRALLLMDLCIVSAILAAVLAYAIKQKRTLRRLPGIQRGAQCSLRSRCQRPVRH